MLSIVNRTTVWLTFIWSRDSFLGRLRIGPAPRTGSVLQREARRQQEVHPCGGGELERSGGSATGRSLSS